VNADTGDIQGYRTPTLHLLRAQSAPVWSLATLHTPHGDFSGLILPRSGTADADHIVLKLGTAHARRACTST
jgi:hypothetical protein